MRTVGERPQAASIDMKGSYPVNRHPEPFGVVGDVDTDSAQADNPEPFTTNLIPGEGFLALFDQAQEPRPPCRRVP